MSRGRSTYLALTVLAVLAIVASGVAALRSHRSVAPAGADLARNPNLDPGTALRGPAPDFTLADQFGRKVSLHDFRGRVVILAFNDSECTTICPLTTAAMVRARALLGRAGGRVQLLGIDANPDATAISDVRSYSAAHGMLHQWRFVTGPLAELRQVWRSYKIDVAIEHGQIDHTPALFVVDARGRLAKLYVTQQSYSAVGQLGEVLAQEVSRLLPDHPRVRLAQSYAQIPTIDPARTVSLPRAGGGSVALGPGRARLTAFFATWVSETSNLARELGTLAEYDRAASRSGLPRVAAVDEGSVEAPGHALESFLRTLPALGYPVAIDASGRGADGYEVQDQPWLVLTSESGRILWYYDVSTEGPLSAAQIARHVRAALASPPPVQAAAAGALPPALAGSPAPLAAIHAQAGRLLGSESALAARIHALRGYPIVLNAWASWCGPCRAEFSLFGSASIRYGRNVAFLGADVNDPVSDARAFLAGHPVSYPSYQTDYASLQAIVPQGVSSTPTTFFINRSGKVAYVNLGQYVAQGTLDADIAQYALGG